MNNPAWIYRKQHWIYLEQWRDRWRERNGGTGAAGGHETGSQAEPARVRGGRGTSLRAGPAAWSWRAVGAGPLPARPGAVRSWRAVGAVGPLPCPCELLASAPGCAVAGGAVLVAGGVRSADRPPGARSDGRERLEGERERGVNG